MNTAESPSANFPSPNSDFNLPSSLFKRDRKNSPHLDLLKVCDFAHDDEDELNNGGAQIGLASLGRQLHRALSEKDSIERINNARAAIEKSNGACGVAWLVLSREGVSSEESAVIYSQRAVERIKQELREQRFSGYCLYNDTCTVAISDAAEMMFIAGKQRDAVAFLQDHHSRDETFSEVQFILRDLACTMLLVMHEPKQALNYLHGNPDNTECWHYLNALATFSTGGDNLTARSALACALQTGSAIAEAIMSGSPNEIACFSDDYAKAIGARHVAIAWQANSAAVRWLRSALQEPHMPNNRESIKIAVLNKDQKRWERWDTAVTTAVYYLEQESYKPGIKELKDALREAERIDYSHFPFTITMEALIAAYKESRRPLTELKNKIDNRVKGKDSLEVPHLYSTGKLYGRIGEHSLSCTFLQKALDRLYLPFQGKEIQLIDTGTLFEAAEIYGELATSLFALGRYEECLTACNQQFAAQERFLGAGHFDQLFNLEIAYECARKLQDKVKEEQVTSRIRAIEPTYPLTGLDTFAMSA